MVCPIDTWVLLRCYEYYNVRDYLFQNPFKALQLHNPMFSLRYISSILTNFVHIQLCGIWLFLAHFHILIQFLGSFIFFM
jgi:hypothetical protein